MSPIESWGIHWFRRDLRVAGNPALHWSWNEHKGRVVGLFCFDSLFLSRPDFSSHRFAFFLETLRALKEELQSIGSDLWVMDCLPQIGFPKIIDSLKKFPVSTVSFNRDYEPFSIERDASITFLLESTLGIQVHTERDHLIIEPQELAKPSSQGRSFYQVYTPFSRRWFELFQTDEVQRRIHFQKSGMRYLNSRLNGKVDSKIFNLTWNQIAEKAKMPFPDALEAFIEKNLPQVSIPIPRAGSQEAFERLKAFQSNLNAYETDRDFPAIPGTSKLGIFLKNGSLTTTQIIAELGITHCTKYLKELIWREFYYSILFHHPQVETLEFHERFRNLNWENDPTYFDAWKNGLTGYPIVDAGMRQLKKEGWMHNRVRMIVASFLTKDLLIDWRWGEKYFMKTLLDGDLAPNNGGWQWAASTGCDPQPYFRIFNPELQSQKFDPTGSYIKKYIPELTGLSEKEIHCPYKSTKIASIKKNYPAPIVEHSKQKMRALELYKKK